MFEATSKSAIEYSHDNKLGEWLHTFLLSEDGNKNLSDAIKRNENVVYTIKKVKFDALKNCFLPEPGDDVEFFLE